MSLDPTLDDSYGSPVLSFNLTPSNRRETSKSRRGQVELRSRSTNAVLQSIQTPGIITYTRRGAVPHLTPDNVARTGIQAIHLPLNHFLETIPPPLSIAPFSLQRFVGLQSETQRIMTVMNLQDETERGPGPVPTGDTFVHVATKRGGLKATSRDFLDWTLPRPPDILIAMADESMNITTSKLHKSIVRSIAWVSEIAIEAKNRTNVFAPLIGSTSTVAREQYSNALMGIQTGHIYPPSTPFNIDSTVAGYSLLIPPHSTPASTSSIPDLFNASLSPLPLHKPRLVHSCAGPHDILTLLSDVGIDLIIDEWSSSCATLGVGLDFTFPAPASATKLDIGHNFFDLKFARQYIPLSGSAPVDETKGGSFGPEAPTQAYTHHLLQSHELTAHVILALHNQYVMETFFSAIRSVLDDGEDRFEEEVKRFGEVYEESMGGAFSGGEYRCRVEAREERKRVDKERGKGSSVRKPT